MEKDEEKYKGIYGQAFNDFYCQISEICKKHKVSFARLIDEEGFTLEEKGIIYYDDLACFPILYDVSIEEGYQAIQRKIASIRFVGVDSDKKNSKLEEDLLKINDPLEN